MHKELKYALDALFLFMIFVSLAVFAIEFMYGVDAQILHAVESIDLAVLGGYYYFFGNGLFTAKNKMRYCKEHWIMIIFLILPFIPVARLARFIHVERIFAIGANTLWHVFDELGLL
jgi:hypothetical protein